MNIEYLIHVKCPFCKKLVKDEFTIDREEDTYKQLKCRCGKSFYVTRYIDVSSKVLPIGYVESNGKAGVGFRLDK